MSADNSLLHRYLAGQHREVWDEILLLDYHGLDPVAQGRVREVVQAFVDRARENIDILYRRLETLGYEFLGDKCAKAVVCDLGELNISITSSNNIVDHATEKTHAALALIQQHIGPISCFLTTWYRSIDTVNFLGRHGVLSTYGRVDDKGALPVNPDPLCVLSPHTVLIEYNSWLFSQDEESAVEEDEFLIPIAPDLDFKAGFAGGGCDGVPSCDDLDSHYTLTGDYLSKYLRMSFEWGGFPGWRHSQRAPRRELQYLTRGLEKL